MTADPKKKPTVLAGPTAIGTGAVRALEKSPEARAEHEAMLARIADRNRAAGEHYRRTGKRPDWAVIDGEVRSE